MTTIAIALVLAFLIVSPGPPGPSDVGTDTLANVHLALQNYRSAGDSATLSERLRLQRQLVSAMTGATIVLQHEPSPAAEAARRELAQIWIELDSGGPTQQAADTDALVASLASHVDLLREALQDDDVDHALTTQAEMLRDAQTLEFTFRFIQTPTAVRVRSALEDLRLGLDGDAQRLEEAGSAFTALTDESAGS